MDLTEMDYIRAAIAQARAVGFNINDIARCAEHAKTAREFDDAVNLLANMVR